MNIPHTFQKTRTWLSSNPFSLFFRNKYQSLAWCTFSSQFFFNSSSCDKENWIWHVFPTRHKNQTFQGAPVTYDQSLMAQNGITTQLLPTLNHQYGRPYTGQIQSYSMPNPAWMPAQYVMQPHLQQVEVSFAGPKK
jgi:hypothetical protein